jgi:hypothetical protein
MKYAEEIRARLKETVNKFAERDPRSYPDLWLHIVDRRRPSGRIYLVGTGVGKIEHSKKLETFNGGSQLGLLVETICREWKKAKKRKSA